MPDLMSGRVVSDESGFTLVEMLVVMMVGIVVLGAALSITENGARSSARTGDRVEVQQRSRLALERVVRSIRSQVCLDSVTPPITAGTGDSITFYTDNPSTTDFRPQRRRITFSTTGTGSITEEIWNTTSVAAPWAFPTSPSRTSTITTNVGKLDGADFLRYYTYNANQLTAPLNASTNEPLASNSVARVVRVDVAFETSPTNGNPELRRRSGLETAVYTRNTEYAEGTSSSTDVWGPRCD